jgi:hypothetical protein
MPLLKDIKTTLNKISMQAEKSNLQFEKTINSIKTSIKNIKDVKLNIKTLKISNDEYNKTLQKSQTNSTKLLKQIDNYLENPTQEEKLKLKNQINVSDNYLIKLKSIFSKNKIFSDKAFVSFKEYKSGDFTSDAKESLEFNQRLKPSFTKLINYFGKLKAKTQTQTQTKTRKVYSTEPTPHPDCQTKKQELEDELKKRTKTEEEIALYYSAIDSIALIYETLESQFDDEYEIEVSMLRKLFILGSEQLTLFNDYKKKFKQVQDDNNDSILTILNLDLKEAIKEDLKKKIKDTKALIASNTKRISDNFNAYEKAIVDLGSITKESAQSLTSTYFLADKILHAKKNKLWRELEKYQTEIEGLIKSIEDNNKLLIIINVNIDRFEKWINKNCPS